MAQHPTCATGSGKPTATTWAGAGRALLRFQRVGRPTFGQNHHQWFLGVTFRHLETYGVPQRTCSLLGSWWSNLCVGEYRSQHLGMGNTCLVLCALFRFYCCKWFGNLKGTRNSMQFLDTIPSLFDRCGHMRYGLWREFRRHDAAEREDFKGACDPTRAKAQRSCVSEAWAKDVLNWLWLIEFMTRISVHYS